MSIRTQPRILDQMGIPFQQQTTDIALLAPVSGGIKLVRIAW
jgi:hypothetical protein